LNSGVALQLYENQEKSIVMAKVMDKVLKKNMNHSKILCYQKWKQMTLFQDSRDQVLAQLSQLLTDPRAVEDDEYL
jgi:hypothetical protein